MSEYEHMKRQRDSILRRKAEKEASAGGTVSVGGLVMDLEAIADLRRQLADANTQARNWETASTANRDAAMGFQDRALLAERRLAEAQARIAKLEEALRVAVRDDATGYELIAAAKALEGR